MSSAPGFQTDQAAIRRAEGDLSKPAPVLEAHLQGCDFVVGESLTVADFALGPAVGDALPGP